MTGSRGEAALPVGRLMQVSEQRSCQRMHQIAKVPALQHSETSRHFIARQAKLLPPDRNACG